MAILNKLQLIADITGNIYTNTLRAIKGNTVKARLLNIVDSTLVRIYDTSTNFTTNNPILKSGEIGIESNTLSTSPKFKIGDGVTAWNSLPYAAASSQTLEQVVTNGGIVTGSDNTTVIFEIDKSNDLINVKTPTYFHDNPVILGEAVAKVVTLDVANRIVSSGINVSDIATKAYAEGLVAGLLDDRGSYDASTNTFPSTGGSGTSGAILKGDFWYISVAGTLGGQAVTVGDSVRALTDAPAQVGANWSVLETNIGYVPENVANKATTMAGNTTSNVFYLSAKAIYDWAVGLFEPTANKQNSLAVDGTGIKFPTVDAVNLALANKLTPYTHVSTAGLNPSDATYYVFGCETIGHTTGVNFTPSNVRGLGINKTGTIRTAIISLYVANAGSCSGEASDFRIYNHSTSTGYTIGTFSMNTGTVNIQTKTFTGLNIPVTLGDMISSVYLTPTWVTNPTGVYMVATYMIE